MRLSEIRGLKRKDIHKGQIHICRAVVDDTDGSPVEKGTKTYSGDRWIALPDYIKELIPEGDPDEYIVHLSGQAIYKRFSRLLDKAGVEHCRFHDLRRANAAAMIRLGVDSKYAQQRNGWSTDYMYKQVYAYTMPDRMTEINSAIDGYFGHKIGHENKSC
jgi:integrase